MKRSKEKGHFNTKENGENREDPGYLKAKFAEIMQPTNEYHNGKTQF